MKKFLITLIALTLMPIAQASDFANIKIRINGNIHDNSYFLCLPSVGCLSILAAKRGKVFPVMHSVPMDSIYVTNVRDMRIYPQGQVSSCNLTVEPSHTVTVSANLSVDGNSKVHLNQLHCRLT